MIEVMKGRAHLRGYRGAPAVDEAAFRTALPVELPDHLDPVLSEDAVASHERPTLGHRVSGQQPVEGVSMMKWQALDGGGEGYEAGPCRGRAEPPKCLVRSFLPD